MKKLCILFFMLFLSLNNIYSYDWKYDWNEIADSIASKQKKECDSIYYNKIEIYKT